MSALSFFVFLAFFLVPPPLKSAAGEIGPARNEKYNPPPALKQFWEGMDDKWLPRTEGDSWEPTNRQSLINYCRSYAKRTQPDKLIPEIIKDMKVRQAEVRAYIYAWLAAGWEPPRTKATLKACLSGKDPAARRAAEDLLSVVEAFSEK